MIPPLPEYPAILRAPLFAPDRQPGAADAEGSSTSGPLDTYAVLGVAVSGSAATAVVAAPGAQPKTVKRGETLEGWRLVSVERSKATFERNGVIHSLIVGAPSEAVARAASGAAATSSDESQSQ